MNKFKLSKWKKKQMGVSEHNDSGASPDGFYLQPTAANKVSTELSSLVSNTKFRNWLMDQFVENNKDIFPEEVFVIYKGSLVKVKVKRYKHGGDITVKLSIDGKRKTKTYSSSEVYTDKAEAEYAIKKLIKNETFWKNHFSEKWSKSKRILKNLRASLDSITSE